jgi:activator of 2-hydroxyglutaryl-CoA dehydratase/predicted nucleotide-binding protein (sugar kinase/HSP70/actin superfamily)
MTIALQTRTVSPPPASTTSFLLIDAGIETFHFFSCYGSSLQEYYSFPATIALPSIASHLVITPETPIFLTGKLHNVVRQHFGRGEYFSSLAVFWSAAAAQASDTSIAILNLSASGYCLVGVHRDGSLKDDLLVTNPRCGSGSGINLDRVLRKLSLGRDEVDVVLAEYLGATGRNARHEIPLRADRCGVFASSATISDKNQGIPIDFALATTLKSEVIKACKQLKTNFGTVWLSGGVFKWQFARECAVDYFSGIGINSIFHDSSHELVFRGLLRLGMQEIQQIGKPPQKILTEQVSAKFYPPFSDIHRSLSEKKLFHRQKTETLCSLDVTRLQEQSLLIGIDVGSTMAKIVISGVDGQKSLYQAAYSNAGDTIETIKAIFGDLQKQGINSLSVARIGLTGSARYQIQKALVATYPVLADRVTVLVENYAHARGSVDIARAYLDELKKNGVTGLNEDLCLLVDIGGEDTKISSIDIERGDLYDNAMNTKCSAGTGSLLDTLADLFSIADIGTAAQSALDAPRAEALNATCAVFLLEHARRLQAEGKNQTEILASAVWAIVENMARSLWPQIYLPPNTLVLLHGQTMQSDPLPLAVAHRLQSFLGGPAYCLVPPNPGHRACFGLIQMLAEQEVGKPVLLPLAVFTDKQFSRKIIQCQGAVCGDRNARCYRSQLTATDAEGEQFTLGLGGCSQINELPFARSGKRTRVPNTCKDIWHFQENMLPVSEAANRLVIPRSFAVSEWARFFASLFEPCDIPVHVDTPQESDILRAQPHFRIDSCAPHIGAVGQFLRLAEQAHGMILAPQIEFLPVSGQSLGRTCTVNQGGFAVARGVAQTSFPQSRIELFYLDLKSTDLDILAHKLYTKLLPVYDHYSVKMTFDDFRHCVHQAMADQLEFRKKVADYVSGLAHSALDAGQGIALVVGREYVLNPGVYDSHVGRLLHDKGLVGIPSYVLNIDCDPDFKHLYWRNAHMLASLAAAVADRRLHEIIPHPGLREVFKRCEQSDALLPMVQVSTFLCGPDSVTNPLISELVKNRPYLRIQSDAAIKELAHLENRLNTYVKQLAVSGRQRISLSGKDSFDVHMLDAFVNRDTLNPETDLICFPTLSDNRGLLAVFRSAGFNCLENYSENHNLQALIELGRGIAGDSVCAPMAAVYGDVQNAITTFQKLRDSDSDIRTKKRLLIFNNKGLGPCRQGQYVEVHKLFMQQSGYSAQNKQTGSDEQVIKFLVGHENEGFNTGFPRWVFLRGVQATVLQGVLHQVLAEGSARCRSYLEYQEFLAAYNDLKLELYDLIEANSAPGPRAAQMLTRTRGIPGISALVAFFAYRLHYNHLTSPLKRFRKTWCVSSVPDSHIRIHIDGEAYMRTAQFEDLHRGLLEILGPGRFHLTYTPIWGFLEYKLAGMLMRSREGIAESRAEIRRAVGKDFIASRKQFMRKKQKRYLGVSCVHHLLRRLIAAPLYRAAGVAMPESVPKVLEVARKVISTRRPGGELIPYVGEAALKLQKQYDLILNVAPEGCMVSSMGEVITPALYAAFPEAKGRIHPIFSQQGDVDLEKLEQALLQALGPHRMHGTSSGGS